jgi:uncharacterized protein (TIGR02145 family)
MPTFKNFTDTRDGKVYKCVLMPDGKWWSAENLAWDGNGYAHTDPVSYGRLYTLTEALAACPAGCHIPTLAEWNDTAITSADVVKENSALWTTNTGTDNYGFAVRPAGYEFNGTIGNVGTKASINLNSTSGNYWTLLDISTGAIALNQGFDPVRFSARFIVDVLDPPTIFPPPGKYYLSPTITLSSTDTIHYTIS